MYVVVRRLSDLCVLLAVTALLCGSAHAQTASDEIVLHTATVSPIEIRGDWVRVTHNNSRSNDSVHVPFSDAVNSLNEPIIRVGSTSSAELVLPSGESGARPSGCGWTEILSESAVPVANQAPSLTTSDLGKPTPDTANEIIVDRTTLLNSLLPGTYRITVSSVGAGGSSRSSPLTFAR
jgi:hypothetical protein